MQRTIPSAPVIPRSLSELSSPAVGDSHWFASDFLLAASTVIIQPSSAKVVIVNNTATRTWFLPRGRKDVGESLEQCALREAFEESGYRAEFLPLYIPSLAPNHPESDAERYPNTEPIFITTSHIERRSNRRGQIIPAMEYLAFYYVGQIPADAVREEHTGMPDEQAYVGVLVELEEALQRLDDVQAWVVHTAFSYWQYTLRLEEKLKKEEEEKRLKREREERNRQDGGSARRQSFMDRFR